MHRDPVRRDSSAAADATNGPEPDERTLIGRFRDALRRSGRTGQPATRVTSGPPVTIPETARVIRPRLGHGVSQRPASPPSEAPRPRRAESSLDATRAGQPFGVPFSAVHQVPAGAPAIRYYFPSWVTRVRVALTENSGAVIFGSDGASYHLRPGAAVWLHHGSRRPVHYLSARNPTSKRAYFHVTAH